MPDILAHTSFLDLADSCKVIAWQDVLLSESSIFATYFTRYRIHESQMRLGVNLNPNRRSMEVRALNVNELIM